MIRVAVLFDNFGPYHRARLASAVQVGELLGIEVARRSGDYAWHADCGALDAKSVCLVSGASRDVRVRDLVERLTEVLDDFCPTVVVVPGWASGAALAALKWAASHRVPSVVMSDSNAWDEPRVVWKEWIKRRIVRLCSAALVAGTSHANYVAELGMRRDQIFLGYDAVDNRYFARGAEEARNRRSQVSSRHSLPQRYFLASARFIQKKNLLRLIEAYARYRELACDFARRGPQPTIWSLVLLGDGPLRDTLNSQLATLNLHAHVQLPGFRQYRDLPAYYGLASAFIHASTTEQWGLVVNEAMASGLPVLVSSRCGCTVDLVQEGRNGFAFDPYDVESLALLMLKISALPSEGLTGLGNESVRIISNWGPQRFASGLKAASQAAIATTPKRASLFDQLLLSALLHR
jgi:1,2-diacylglycerol 3-alpha-glucosyltransferase